MRDRVLLAAMPRLKNSCVGDRTPQIQLAAMASGIDPSIAVNFKV